MCNECFGENFIVESYWEVIARWWWPLVCGSVCWQSLWIDAPVCRILSSWLPGGALENFALTNKLIPFGNLCRQKNSKISKLLQKPRSNKRACKNHQKTGSQKLVVYVLCCWHACILSFTLILFHDFVWKRRLKGKIDRHEQPRQQQSHFKATKIF